MPRVRIPGASYVVESLMIVFLPFYLIGNAVQILLNTREKLVFLIESGASKSSFWMSWNKELRELTVAHRVLGKSIISDNLGALVIPMDKISSFSAFLNSIDANSMLYKSVKVSYWKHRWERFCIEQEEPSAMEDGISNLFPV